MSDDVWREYRDGIRKTLEETALKAADESHPGVLAMLPALRIYLPEGHPLRLERGEAYEAYEDLKGELRVAGHDV